MAESITFVLNDEAVVNTYGFAVRNSALDLTRFNKNPVMLFDHRWDSGSVIGRWENVRIEGTELKADAVFDEEDEVAVGIKGKVERNFLRGCSIGFRYRYIDTINGVDYFGGELLEASICAIPSNGSSVKLYATEGEQRPLNDEEVISLLSASKSNSKKINNNQIPTEMEDKEKVALEAQIADLKAENKQLKADIDSIKKNHTESLGASAEADVNAAIADGKILAMAKDSTIEFYKQNPVGCKAMLAGIPSKRSLQSEIEKPGSESGEFKTIKELTEKLSGKALQEWIDNNKEKYSTLYHKEFGIKLK
mgnify:CR=1 FL=1